jgi:hypothetical protein
MTYRKASADFSRLGDGGYGFYDGFCSIIDLDFSRFWRLWVFDLEFDYDVSYSCFSGITIKANRLLL